MNTDSIHLAHDQVRVDLGTQSRAELCATTITEYCEAMKRGDKFPAGTAFYDGSQHILVDGFQRRLAAIQAGIPSLPYDVKQGTVRDAILFSVGANARHGKPRTHADKKQAVERLLRDSEWRSWSDSEIARHAFVDHKTVAHWRDKLTRDGNLGIPKLDPTTANGLQLDSRTYTRNGKQQTMNTAAIGQKIAPEARKALIDSPIREIAVEIGRLERLPPEKHLAVIEKVNAGEAKTVSKAAVIVRQEEQVAAGQPAQEPTTTLQAWPRGRFPIIYADPPWAFNDRRNTHTRFCGGARAHYGVMETDEICALPVADLATTDAMLFLWACWPMMEDAYRVIKAWGFRPVTCAFNWIKLNEDGTPFFGIGYYTKSNSEVCILGVRGEPWTCSNEVAQVVMSRRREHSRKPDEVRDRIVQLCGDRPRIELFARQAAPGWHAWGNQTDRFDGLLPVQDAPEATLSDVCQAELPSTSTRERPPKLRWWFVRTRKHPQMASCTVVEHVYRERARTPEEARARIASLPLVVEVLDVRPVEEVPS